MRGTSTKIVVASVYERLGGRGSWIIGHMAGSDWQRLGSELGRRGVVFLLGITASGRSIRGIRILRRHGHRARWRS
jgi:hypothetical protein